MLKKESKGLLDFKEEYKEAVRKSLKVISKDFASSLVEGSKAFYSSRQGGLSRFKKSELIQSVKSALETKDLIISLNDYVVYLDSGRKPKTKKVPIQAIMKWMAKSGIQGGIKTAYKIQSSIYKKGISPRKFVEPALAGVIKTLDKLADEVIDRLDSTSTTKTIKTNQRTRRRRR
jgi:hypothetical protein